MRGGVGGLVQEVLGSRERRSSDVLAFCFGQEKSPQGFADEEPLQLDGGIFHECLHQGPGARSIERDAAAAAIGGEVHVEVLGGDGPPRFVEDVEREVDVATGLMRVRPGNGSSSGGAEVSHAKGRGPGEFGSHGASGLLDGRHEPRNSKGEAAGPMPSGQHPGIGAVDEGHGALQATRGGTAHAARRTRGRTLTARVNARVGRHGNAQHQDQPEPPVRHRFERSVARCKVLGVIERSKELLRTAFAGASLVGLTGTYSAAVTALSFIDERAPDPFITRWADQVLMTSGVRTQVRGLENLPTGNFVLCANHQSNFDVLVIFRHIERHMRFVAKAQLRRVPVFGYALARAGNIFVDRQGTTTDRDKLHDAVRAVRERVSVVFFAEGTRSDDGILRPFKKGAAIMALEAQVPLVPVAVAGTHRILPKGTVAIRPRPAALVIGRPIETVGLSVDARDAVTERAHAEVEKLLAEGNALVAEMEA